MERRRLEGRERAHFIADSFTLLHVFIVGGIIALAAAVEEILLHPRDEVHTEFLVMLVGGLAMFFLGIAAGAFRAYRIFAKERFAAAVLIALLALLGRSWDGVVLLIAVDLVLLITIVAEQIRIESPSSDESEVAATAT